MLVFIDSAVSTVTGVVGLGSEGTAACDLSHLPRAVTTFALPQDLDGFIHCLAIGSDANSESDKSSVEVNKMSESFFKNGDESRFKRKVWEARACRWLYYILEIGVQACI
uniref:Uncharacterized protein n=1 Tax=Parascaris equorum TaxID=6256 RepID=A0A914S652_PAREQ